METPAGINAAAWEQVRMGAQGAVVTNHPLSSLAGMRILTNGGNAVDAAVAIGFALGVTEPQGSGIASDGFLMVHMKEERSVSIANGTGTAPLGATPERFAGGIVDSGILSVSVPGVCDALLAAHDRHGRLPLADCIQPAIELCLEGVPQSHFQCRLAASHDLLHSFPASAAIFAPDGVPLQPGQIRRNPDLAKTYRLIAEHGRDVFYEGPLADGIVAFSEQAGGLLTKEDFTAFRMQWQEPISTTYRGRTVYEAPPNSSGHVLLQELNLIEHFDMAALGLHSAEAIHVMAEAKKLAFADREAYLGDPDFVDVPIEGLLSKEYAAERGRLIDPERAAGKVAAGDPWAFQGAAPRSAGAPGGGLRETRSETTHYCVVDRWGNAVDGLQSLSGHFGSQVVCPGTGMLLNNRMNYWHLDAGHPDLLTPGKRVRHTMNPVMVFDGPAEEGGALNLCCGTPGADMQVQVNMQLISAIYDHGLSVTEAIHAPRWTHMQAGMSSKYPHENKDDMTAESRFGEDVLADLGARGQPVRAVGPWGGGASAGAIQVGAFGSYLAASDPRRDGQALVF
ncbi:gamma-glutamyltransferase [Nisaea acidiphila]|uniref:Glutathione hydrolase proenzyme n=1 Tax=Nisaea acidiphila TaxID=1862145 RepID=A0A9J7AWA6_9PROT|nr:gamma-glutamyltransferase [Nisaea acidiphila]UUX50729.1 gamma-glutamyltransferase [Nisaea acidiphila]